VNRYQNLRYWADWRAPAAAAALRSGAVVACAAEGVWGLSCNPNDEDAVLTILQMKSREVGKGLIVVAASAAVFSVLLEPLPASERAAVLNSWPGPHTWLVPHRNLFPRWITGESDEVAIRVTSAPALTALCRAFGGPVVSTSANPGGLPPARTVWQLRRYFGAALMHMPGVLDPMGKASTIRRVGDGSILRA
jgi:L-threonylcarbamoyladenylate synthase